MQLPRLVIVLSAVTFTLNACYYPNRPPEIQGSRSFLGTEAIAAEYASDDKRPSVRMIFTHGMCSDQHRANWVGERLSALLEATDAETVDSYDFDKYSFPNRETPVVHRYEAQIAGGSGVVYDLAFFLWGNSIDIARSNLDYENDALSDGVPRRAAVNSEIKSTLLDDCLIDAVYYIGSSGDKIRRNMREAVCDYLGGEITTDNYGRVGEPATCSGWKSETAPLVLVPDSLGSKILFDAIIDIGLGTGNSNVASALGPVEAIHFTTNQIPLLNVSSGYNDTQNGFDRGVAATSSNGETESIVELESFLTLNASYRARNRKTRKPDVVAYIDPNDLFAYRLRQEHLGKSNASLTNVIVSNAPVYFGVYANPISAHTKAQRPEIFDMIVNGLNNFSLAP